MLKYKDYIIAGLFIVLLYFTFHYKISSDFWKQEYTNLYTETLQLPTEILKADTIYYTETDTIFIEAPLMHSRKLLYDTLIVLLYDTIKLPREQIYYKEDSLYEAWVSGVYPSLDSINIVLKNDVTQYYIEKQKTVYKNKRFGIGPYIGVLI